jgi:hypothetical protein
VSATVQRCLPGTEGNGGSATFAGQMVTLSGSQQMAMRVELEERTSSEPEFHTVSAPGLGVWHKSEPSVRIFRYLAQVTNLSGPAAYRAVFSFHWLAVGGHVMRHATRRTPVCRESASGTAPAAPKNAGTTT